MQVWVAILFLNLLNSQQREKYTMGTMSIFTTLQVNNKEILTRSFKHLAKFPSCVKHPQLMTSEGEGGEPNSAAFTKDTHLSTSK